MTGIFSRDPIERRDAWRLQIRRLAAARNVAHARLAAVTNHARQRFSAMLEDGQRTSVALADIGPLVEALGPEILDPLLRPLGLEVRPIDGAGAAVDVHVALGKLAKEVGDVMTRVAEHAPGGYTPSERAEVHQEVADLRRAVEALVLAVEAQTVEAPVRALRGGR